MVWCSWCVNGMLSRGYDVNVKEQLQGKCTCESCGEDSEEEIYLDIELAD